MGVRDMADGGTVKGDEWNTPPFQYSGKYDGPPPGCFATIIISVLIIVGFVLLAVFTQGAGR